ncbi:unnamed protein product [Schistocephalus solidus]|uniref:Reverse transcriptase domain-containing protein n=1 Tax=Schistocephalus solidus TaxID=70667 RepID=A0A183TIW6_SCHSO|nr:unnamed protein product [Schistocephalus solidus]
MDLRTDATKAAFFRCRRLVQQRLWEMRDAWMVREAEEIQGYADLNEMKNIVKVSKASYGPCIKGTTPLLNSNRTTLLTKKSEVLAEHFNIPQLNTNNDLDLPPSLQETIRAVQKASNGKAPQSDEIPPEIYKNGWPRLMVEPTTILQKFWHQGQVPQNIKDSTIVRLYKQKGNRVTDNVTVSEAFEVTIGVKRGCVLVPTLFRFIFSAMLMDAYRGIRVAYRTDGNLPNSQCMQAPMRVYDFSPRLALRGRLYANHCDKGAGIYLPQAAPISD